MVRVVPATLAFALLFVTAGPVAASPGDPVAARERAAAVIVWSHIADHSDAIGAGVVVAVSGRRFRVATARHVVAFGAITVWRDGRRYPAEIARTFEARDVALVDVVVPAGDALPVPAAVTDTQATQAGDSLAVWGEDQTGPTLERATLATAYMPALGDPQAHDMIDLACTTCKPGDSGGGVYDAAGRLIGILVGRYYTATGDRTVAIVAEPLVPEQLAFG